MSAALINRSLTNARTELEFLLDSEVITKDLYDVLMASLPAKYQKDMAPWGVDKVPTRSAQTDLILEMSATSLKEKAEPPKAPARAEAPVPPRPNPVIGYCKASYDYTSSEDGDLKLTKDVRIAVIEHLSPDWWKGYKQGEDSSRAGVFPSNYVAVISEAEFNATHLEKGFNEKATYNDNSVTSPPAYQGYTAPSGAPPQGYQPQQNYGQGYQPQPSYGGYAQFPPPSTNYYPAQQQQQQQQQPQDVQQQQPEGGHRHSRMEGHMKSVGSKFGNAAVFGAGATLGSDLIHLIF